MYSSFTYFQCIGRFVIILNLANKMCDGADPWNPYKRYEYRNHNCNAVVDKHILSAWIWKGVSATLQAGRYTLSYPRGRFVTNYVS